MDLNVNFQELKHNFEKVWGCFCKITRRRLFSNFGFIFLLENLWNRFIAAWTRSMGFGPRVHNVDSLRVVGFKMNNSYLMKTKGYLYSNRDRTW
jgi:hypothetical protein